MNKTRRKKISRAKKTPHLGLLLVSTQDAPEEEEANKCLLIDSFFKSLLDNHSVDRGMEVLCTVRLSAKDVHKLYTNNSHKMGPVFL